MFHNKQLKKTHDNSKNIISEYHKYLDNLSNDIKYLEDILNNSGIGEFSFEFSSGKHLEFSEGRIRYIDFNLTETMFAIHKPLIEHKATIRVEVSENLPRFFDLCMDKIKKGLKNVGIN